MSRQSVRVTGTVAATPPEVWRAFTTSEGAQSFFAQKANIELEVGGPYEIFFDPKDERQGTKGLKILSYAPEEMISFQWNAPPQFPVVRDGGTWVVVQLRRAPGGGTGVTVSHLGWKSGGEWDAAYPHFVQGWKELMARLERRFATGPIDWNAELMMYQKEKR
jgi:uncharacterized protein YndB with AHSA1/START domain